MKGVLKAMFMRGMGIRILSVFLGLAIGGCFTNFGKLGNKKKDQGGGVVVEEKIPSTVPCNHSSNSPLLSDPITDLVEDEVSEMFGEMAEDHANLLKMITPVFKFDEVSRAYCSKIENQLTSQLAYRMSQIEVFRTLPIGAPVFTLTNEGGLGTGFYQNLLLGQYKIVDVLSQGAVGDGVVDDTEAIQKSLELLRGYDGVGILLFPPKTGSFKGVYKVSRTVGDTDGSGGFSRTLIMGYQATIQSDQDYLSFDSAKHYSVFNMTGNFNAVLGLSIYLYNQQGSGTAYGRKFRITDPLDMSQADNLYVRNIGIHLGKQKTLTRWNTVMDVTIGGAAGSSILLEDVTRGAIKNNHISDFGYPAVTVLAAGGVLDGVLINQNRMERGASHCIYVSSVKDPSNSIMPSPGSVIIGSPDEEITERLTGAPLPGEPGNVCISTMYSFASITDATEVHVSANYTEKTCSGVHIESPAGRTESAFVLGNYLQQFRVDAQDPFSADPDYSPPAPALPTRINCPLKNGTIDYYRHAIVAGQYSGSYAIPEVNASYNTITNTGQNGVFARNVTNALTVNFNTLTNIRDHGIYVTGTLRGSGTIDVDNRETYGNIGGNTIASYGRTKKEGLNYVAFGDLYGIAVLCETTDCTTTFNNLHVRRNNVRGSHLCAGQYSFCTSADKVIFFPSGVPAETGFYTRNSSRSQAFCSFDNPTASDPTTCPDLLKYP